MQHLVVVVRSNGLTQGGSRTSTVIHNETVGTGIESPDLIKLKLCTLASMLAKRDIMANNFSKDAKDAKLLFDKHVSAFQRNLRRRRPGNIISHKNTGIYSF